MARIVRRLVGGASISKRAPFLLGASISKLALFLVEGVVTISFPLLFCGVATSVVAVVDFLGWGHFVGTFAFAFVPLEEGEEGLLAVERCNVFFGGDLSSLLSANGFFRDTLGIVRLCVRAPVC